MSQNFLSFALTDWRFSFASLMAIFASTLLPLAAVLVLLAATQAGPMGALAALMAGLVWGMLEWAVLLCRMARRIALGQEDTSLFLDLPLFSLSRHILRAYY